MDYKELIGKLGFWSDVFLVNSMEECRELVEKSVTAIETLLAERDAAVSILREINWCAGCINFKGLRGCGDNAMDVCCKENDHYQFGGTAYKEE